MQTDRFEYLAALWKQDARTSFQLLVISVKMLFIVSFGLIAVPASFAWGVSVSLYSAVRDSDAHIVEQLDANTE
jgi:hypothetical protein